MGSIRRTTRKRLGELLLHEGLINDEQLELGLEEQKNTGELIGEILVRKGFVTETDVARTIATQFSFPYLSVSHYYIAPEMMQIFSLEELEKHCFVPIDAFGDVLSIVVAGPLDQDVMDEIEKKAKATVHVYVGTVSDVKQVIKDKFAGDGKPAKAAHAAGKGAAAGAATATAEVDVTAPPRAAKKVGPPAGDEARINAAEANEEIARAADAAEANGDETVVKELEEQFKKFRFFDDDKKDEKKDSK